MIDLKAAARLLNFGARIGEGQRAQEQLEGAVAIHNILSECGVAYLADEVGMGKTYVALGVLALFRHYQPNFRTLIIAPRENIQIKWMKEFRNFIANNVRFRDLRVKALDGLPARPLVACNNLRDLVHQVIVDPNRDFFLRLTSFSLPVVGKDAVEPETARRIRNALREDLPWMNDEVFDLRNKQAFKDNIARAVCCALPKFDLVIVDEAHNLKHGFGEHVSARNRILALAMGRPGEVNRKLFPGFGPRAERVLFLSATPVEETYRHLWNQLDVFGRSGAFDDLRNPDLEDDAKKAIASRFVIRRVTTIRVGETDYTKNLYRREWRRGGLLVHDEPIRVEDPKQRLVVALVQKKVSELLGHERFNSSFQIGMLASFESFLETTRLKREDAETGNFDDSDQTDDLDEREGIDVADVNRLSRSYRRKFGVEMPHPKMDAVVEALSNAWKRGEKSLIFVRRVASVKELKKKLDECYDAWLMARLLNDLPVAFHSRLGGIFRQYRAEKLKAESMSRQPTFEKAEPHNDQQADRGGRDTFFAWFFRGDGPRGVISGANIQQRFVQRGAAYATFFEDNYVAEVLGCSPGQVEQHLAQALHVELSDLRKGLVKRSKRFLSRAIRQQRADRFEAIQAAAIEWLKERSGPHREMARIIWRERFEPSLRIPHAEEAPDPGNLLELPTFFTALREREDLRSALWPRSREGDPLTAFRERELRAQLLASAARLGHPLIDLYVMTVSRLGSLELRAQEAADDESSSPETQRIAEFLDLLEGQMKLPREDRDWNSFDELSDIATNFDLLLDTNAPEARFKPLTEMASYFGKQLLRGQQPVGGMFGQVNQTLVRQFRMPGYPLVLVTTDLLQEGEDLHTFCSAIHHYGIAWTPSSMEQRIGRVDRVRSLTERRLVDIQGREPRKDELLQVYYPHLEDTVEVLQVQRVLERMNLFMRLMHHGLATARNDEPSIDATKEFLRGYRTVEPIRELLESAFPTRRRHLIGTRGLAVSLNVVRDVSARFARLTQETFPDLEIVWEKKTADGLLFGTANLGTRVQPFKLIMRSVDQRLAVRCISPVGCVSPGDDQDRVLASAAVVPIWIGAIETRDNQTYDLTVEGEVLLDSSGDTDAARVGTLISRVVHQADRLEQEYLPGRDAVLATFQAELIQEVSHGR